VCFGLWPPVEKTEMSAWILQPIPTIPKKRNNETKKRVTVTLFNAINNVTATRFYNQTPHRWCYWNVAAMRLFYWGTPNLLP
jgi:hypothetical protein